MVLRRSEWLAKLGTSLVEMVELLELVNKLVAIANES